MHILLIWFRCNTLHLVIFHSVLSYPILSSYFFILSYPIISFFILSHLILLFLFSFYLILYHTIISYPFCSFIIQKALLNNFYPRLPLLYCDPLHLKYSYHDVYHLVLFYFIQHKKYLVLFLSYPTAQHLIISSLP